MTGDVVPVRPRPPEELDEGPTPEDIARFSGVTRSCPECGAELYDDVELCWNCGHSLADPASRRPPLWALIAGALLLIAFLFVFGF